MLTVRITYSHTGYVREYDRLTQKDVNRIINHLSRIRSDEVGIKVEVFD